MPAGKVYKYNQKKGLNEVENQQVNRKIKRMIANRQEKKIHSQEPIGSISTTPSFNQISNIAQGDTDLTRDGDELYLKSIHLNWSFVGADATNKMRIVVFQWFGDDNANPPAATDLFQTNSATGYFGAFRKDYSSLFKVLYDKQLVTDTYNNIRHGKKSIYKGFRKKIKYIAGTASGTNQIYTCMVSDSSAASHPQVSMYTWLRFTDS